MVAMRDLRIGSTWLRLLQGDITTCDVDAIVNAANSALRGGGGVDGAIHKAAGPRLMEECRQIGQCPTGSACVTGAGKLKALHVIHAVGPIWAGGARREAELLASAYQSSLAAAEERKLRTIAFPSISTGAYGYPLESAAKIALETIVRHLSGESGLREVRIFLYRAEDLAIYEQLLSDIVFSSTSG